MQLPGCSSRSWWRDPQAPQITEHVETTPHPAVVTVSTNRHAGTRPVQTQQEVKVEN